MNIQEDFVSFETAKLLKEKGFDEYTTMVYNQNGSFMPNGAIEDTYQTFYSAPTLQMAMKWLREVHNIFISIQQHMDCSYVWYIYTTEGVPKGCDREPKNYSYEHACEAAIKYCLEDLV